MSNSNLIRDSPSAFTLKLTSANRPELFVMGFIKPRARSIFPELLSILLQSSCGWDIQSPL
ncbi:MAG: hypothetical protein V2A53_00585 [bacterium]